MRVGLADSKRRARELIGDGAIFVNGHKVGAAADRVTGDSALFGRFLVIRRGKRTYRAATLDRSEASPTL